MVLGVGYAILAIALLLMARKREQRVRRALRAATYDELPSSWVTALTALTVALALATLVLVVAAS